MYPVEYAVRESSTYTDWFDRLRDLRAKARITERIQRLSYGYFGDVMPVGEGVSELRFNFGPGYRIYFVTRGRSVVILLAGGDKTTQGRDVETARRLASQL